MLQIMKKVPCVLLKLLGAMQHTVKLYNIDQYMHSQYTLQTWKLHKGVCANSKTFSLTFHYQVRAGCRSRYNSTTSFCEAVETQVRGSAAILHLSLGGGGSESIIKGTLRIIII